VCKSRGVTEPIFDVVVVGSANLDLVANLDHLPTPGETLIAIGYAEYPGGKGVNQAVAWGVEDNFFIPRSRVVLAQLEVPLETIEVAFAQAKDDGAITVLNPAPAREIPQTLLSLANIVVPNETESAAIGGTQQLLKLGVATVVTTLGADGASIDTSTSTTHIAPHKVTPIDTVGAGDAFIGATCAELSRGASIEDAARMGAIAGALATTVKGAVPSLPTRQAVLAAQKS